MCYGFDQSWQCVVARTNWKGRTSLTSSVCMWSFAFSFRSLQNKWTNPRPIDQNRQKQIVREMQRCTVWSNRFHRSHSKQVCSSIVHSLAVAYIHFKNDHVQTRRNCKNSKKTDARAPTFTIRQSSNPHHHCCWAAIRQIFAKQFLFFIPFAASNGRLEFCALHVCVQRWTDNSNVGSRCNTYETKQRPKRNGKHEFAQK